MVQLPVSDGTIINTANVKRITIEHVLLCSNLTYWSDTATDTVKPLTRTQSVESGNETIMICTKQKYHGYSCYFRSRASYHFGVN